jgi:signal transduction histidine kinase
VKTGIATRYAANLTLLILAVVATALLASGFIAFRRVETLQSEIHQALAAIQAREETETLQGMATYLSDRLFNPLHRLDVERLNEEITQIRAWLPVTAFLIADSEGLILTDGTTTIERYGEPLRGELPSGPPWTPRLVRREQGIELRFAVRSGESLAGWAVVNLAETASRASLRRMEESTADLWTGYRSSLLYLALLVLAITVVLGGLTGVRLSRTLVRPLVEMSGAARRFAAGELQHSVAAPSRDELGDLARALNGMAHDLRRHEAEREHLIADLERKNTELERFSYTVSHDLKSPLVTIQGFAGLIGADLDAGKLDRARDGLERIVAASHRMHGLLDDLLELSRIGRTVDASGTVELAEVAREAVEVLRGRLEARGVAVHVAKDMPVVRGDRQRLVQVFQNLVENAVKFSADQAAPRVEVGVRHDGDETVCYVADNGQGIEAKLLDRVFGLFEKLNPRAEGTGVGLALVRRIVEAHGGRVWAESDGPGRGATFCLTLPPATVG